MEQYPFQKPHFLFWILLLLFPTLAWGTAKKTSSNTKNTAKSAFEKITATTKKSKKEARVVEQITAKQRTAELLKVRKAGRIFLKASGEYLREMGIFVKKRYLEKRTLVAGGYEARLSSIEKKERLSRQLSIQRFIAFVRKYPKHQKFTPDAMYRLSELYYDKEFLDYLAATKKYEEEFQRFENKKTQQ